MAVKGILLRLKRWVSNNPEKCCRSCCITCPYYDACDSDVDAELYAGEDRHELNMVFQFELMDVDGGESRKWEPEHPWKLTDIKKIQTRWQTGLDGKAWNSLYWNNHDQPRVVSRFGCTKDEKSRVRSAKMLAVCLYLMQGTPYIYQGEELGMTNKHFDSIDPINDVMTRYQEPSQANLLTLPDMRSGQWARPE